MMPNQADHPRTLVSTEWLAGHLEDPDLRVVDATWFLEPGRDARAEHAAAHIPGARFFDLDAISDPQSGLPHMAPSPEMFAERMGALGIGTGNRCTGQGPGHGRRSQASGRQEGRSARPD